MAGILDIESISFRYPGKALRDVFTDISLSLEKGSVFCLLGPNGSGKSTFLKCLVSLLQPHQGRIMVDGTDIQKVSAPRLAAKIGFVPQSLVSAFPFSVADIVVMGRASRISVISSPTEKDRRKARAAMERIGISHLSDRPCNRLSGGEWQLVLIARALTQSPDILILDEPTSHLDMGNQIRILEVVDSLSKEGITIIMASHFPDHAFLNADRVGILKHGRMDIHGRPDHVLSEKVLADTYGIRIRVIEVLEGINRKICVPMLRTNEKGENAA